MQMNQISHISYIVYVQIWHCFRKYCESLFSSPIPNEPETTTVSTYRTIKVEKNMEND